MTEPGPLHGPPTFAEWLRTCTAEITGPFLPWASVEAELDGPAAEVTAELLPGSPFVRADALAPARAA